MPFGYRPASADTLSAAYYAQFALNGGKPVAQSIPATEHSVMTSWPSGAPDVHAVLCMLGYREARAQRDDQLAIRYVCYACCARCGCCLLLHNGGQGTA